MSARGERLAAQLEAANEELARHLEALGPEEWLAPTPADDEAATIDLLRRNAAIVAARVRGLGDEELDRPGLVSGEPTTAEGEFVNRQLNHVRSHLRSIRGGR